MPSTTASALDANMSSKPSLDQLRLHLSGKPMLKFETPRRSDTSGSGIDPNLLSPPLSVESLDTPPFKPVDSDTTSLSMKNRRRRKARRHRDGMDRASTGDAEEKSKDPRPTRKRLTSTSVPDLRHGATRQRIPSAAGQLLMRQQFQAMHVAHRRDSLARSVGSKRRASLPRKPRRWTMPSKAASTRVLSECPTPVITTTIVPSKDQQELSQAASGTLGTSPKSLLSSSQSENDSPAANAGETPAMIILRRASKKCTSSITRRTSLRPNAITSFPPPKFNRTTSTYLSSFFGISSPQIGPKMDDPLQTTVRQSSWSTGHDTLGSLQKASVTADKVQLTANTLAAPAFTQVEFPPLSHSHMNHQELATLSARRCSTTIISGSSVHEIIWDENITSSSEGSTSADVSRQTSKTAKRSGSRDHGRRQSVLVEKLEAQLRHNDQRKVSLGSQNSSASGTSADGNDPRKSRLRKLTGWNLGGLDESYKPQQTSLHMDPEPQFNHDLSLNADVLFATLQGEDQLSPTTERVGYFPPLEGTAGNSPRSSISQKHFTRGEPKHVLIEEPNSSITDGPAARSETAQHDTGKAGKHSARSSTPRRPSLFDHHLPAGSGRGQSSHVRKGSTPSNRPILSTWSRKTSKHKASEDAEFDEYTPLLAHEQRPEDYASPYVFVDGQNAFTPRSCDADAALPPRKMSVQDFVHKIERMGQGRVMRSKEGGEDGGGGDLRGVVGLVRRDSPWVVRRGESAAMGEMEGRWESGRGTVLSEVGEYGEDGGSVLSVSREGSAVFV